MSSTPKRVPLWGPFPFKQMTVKIHMQFQGADYSFEVLPEPLSAAPTYQVLREGKVVFRLRNQGDAWVEEATGAATAFVQGLGAAIRHEEAAIRQEDTAIRQAADQKLSTAAQH